MGNYKESFLDVNGKKVLSYEINYEDLIALYKQYIDKHGKLPIFHQCKVINNLPQGRVINRILEEKNILYCDFIAQFGIDYRIRTECPEKYDIFVDRFKKKCAEIGRTITSDELRNSQYGLPTANWFVKYCPDNNVDTYKKFIAWCGLAEAKHIWTKDEVDLALVEYEKKTGKPITRNDMTSDKVGFSSIVVNRIYGNLGNAKKELGLMKTLPTQPKSFEIYKDALTDIVKTYIKQTGRKYISWKDIESGKYGNYPHEHKTYMQSFKRAGVDLHAYINSLGCMMNPNSFSYKYTFDDGERVDSYKELEVSNYLRSLGLKYNHDYFRFVKYKTFAKDNSRRNCDYVIKTPQGELYVEVAGIIHNLYYDWRNHVYPSEIENEYRDSLARKEDILNGLGFKYLFLFSNDFDSDGFKSLIDQSIEELSMPISA